MLKRLTLMALCIGSLVGATHAKDWSIPLAGNAYRTAPQPGNQGFRRGGGGLTWSDPESVYSIFFHCDRPAKLELAIAATSVEGPSELVFRVLDKEFEVTLAADQTDIGAVQTTDPGYIRIDVQGRDRKGATFGSLDALSVRSETEGLTLDFVRNNQGNMFYWGRRGPSAHLRYGVPDGKTIQYAYNEITVPEGEDPIGSYFMANGFSQGYFGIQVNSPTERRVLFSVWSPYKTDNPREIPEDQRIETLGQGPEVTIGQFGNEGSGGQSYLRYPWEAGRTYRFLTEVRPDGAGKSIYTCWFGDKAKNEWRLIASFRRPKTDTYLTGFHSFIESFSPTYGYIGRRAHYGNTWVRDTEGQWHECLNARFSVDATANGRHRLDYQGGAIDGAFYLRNCGFFSPTAKPGATFTRQSTANDRPEIDFSALPRN